ncbi:peptidyl-prolyl cis-trans isomerase FKBP14-like [Styela clava]
MDMGNTPVWILTCVLTLYVGVTCGSLQFKVEVLQKPDQCERLSKYGDQVFVHFNGTKFDTGELFDKSHPDKPFRFQLGIGEVIEGFEEGLIDMCPGEKRRLTVPPNMAYGVDGGSVPQMPGGTIIFEVELVHAEQGPRHPDVFKEMDLDADKHLSKFEFVHYLRMEVEKAKGHTMSSAEEMKLTNDIFELEDFNKDGFISIWEFSGNKHDEF